MSADIQPSIRLGHMKILETIPIEFTSNYFIVAPISWVLECARLLSRNLHKKERNSVGFRGDRKQEVDVERVHILNQ